MADENAGGAGGPGITDEEAADEDKTEVYESPENLTDAVYEPAADLTNTKKNISAWFERNKTLKVLVAVFVVVIGGGLLFNALGKKKDGGEEEERGRAARTPRDFLEQQLSRAGRSDGGTGAEAAAGETGGLPQASWGGDVAGTGSQAGGGGAARPYTGGAGALQNGQGSAPPPSAPAASSGGGGPAPPKVTYFNSPLVPPIEGSLFGGRAGSAATTAPAAGSYAAAYPYAQAGQSSAYAEALAALQNSQAQNPGAAVNPYAAYGAGAGAAQTPGNDPRAFYDGTGGGGALTPGDGSFLGDNSLWIGTLVPAVLESGVDTSLPGNVVARVTENIFDSRTGKSLLLPQGTLLFARYNSAVNYAQHRVQIVWDSLIRPDGYYVELGGMPAVDSEGFSGSEGVYHENWLEYLKAAGIITMFSLANASMTAEAAKHTTDQAASNIAETNSQFVAQTGNAIVSRAMGVGPTITVEQGTRLSIMLNKTVYFPPVENIPVTQKYSLK